MSMFKYTPMTFVLGILSAERTLSQTLSIEWTLGHFLWRCRYSRWKKPELYSYASWLCVITTKWQIFFQYKITYLKKNGCKVQCKRAGNRFFRKSYFPHKISQFKKKIITYDFQKGKKKVLYKRNTQSVI